MKSRYRTGSFGLVLLTLILILSAANLCFAQTTEFFFQGKLPNFITPSTDIYEMEFKLFDAAEDGNQIGTTITISGVEVKNRAYTVRLDFGAAAFAGADRFMEVSVRLQNTGEPFTVISPREQILSAPYAIRALDATRLGGIDLSEFVLTSDPRLTDARNPLSNSPYYIQNSTSQQTGANFNISGNGTAGGTLSGNIVSATTQYNLFGSRVLGVTNSSTIVGLSAGATNAGNRNSFFGRSAGALNVSGSDDSFFGYNAGLGNTLGTGNSFFGANAGVSNTTGYSNSFFGRNSGYLNNAGAGNSFFGDAAGERNTTGLQNSFFGASAGLFNTGGSGNSFFGLNAGLSNTVGQGNSFFGGSAGDSNTTGNHNTLIGYLADVSAGNLMNATAIGANAIVSQSNSIVLGNNANVGIGTSAPKAKLDVRGGNLFIAKPNGLMMTSPNGACWLIAVDNTGILSTISVPCPN